MQKNGKMLIKNTAAIPKNVGYFDTVTIFTLLTVTWGLLLFFINGKFCADCVDHSWYTSFAYNVYYHDYFGDKLAGVSIGEPKYFGILRAYLYGLVSDVFGWTPFVNRLLSATFILLSSFICYFTLQRTFNDKLLSTFAAFCIIIFEPFVYSGQFARAEAINIFFLFLSFYLATRRHYFVAGVIAGLAFETHIMGFSAYIYIFTCLIYFKDYRSFKYLVSFVLGGIAGLCYYFILHFNFLNDLVSLIENDFPRSLPGSFIYEYFFKSRFHRHLPELFVIFFLIGFVSKAKLYRKPEVNFSLMGLLFISLLLIFSSHGNKHYGVYMFPFLVILLGAVISNLKRSKLWVAGAFSFYLFQYAALIYLNRDYNENEYVAMIKQNVRSDETYVGHFNHWWAFVDDKNHEFYWVANSRAPIENQKFIWIRDSIWEPVSAQPSSKLSRLTQTCPGKLLSKFDYGKHHVRFEEYDCTKQ